MRGNKYCMGAFKCDFYAEFFILFLVFAPVDILNVELTIVIHRGYISVTQYVCVATVLG